MRLQIFLNISSVLSVFDIKPVKGEDGKLQIPNVEYVSSAISYVLLSINDLFLRLYLD